MWWNVHSLHLYSDIDMDDVILNLPADGNNSPMMLLLYVFKPEEWPMQGKLILVFK